jgi:hypothetical protein
MKYNKGFTPIAILLVILGIAAIGILYYARKNSASNKEVRTKAYTPSTVEQNSTTSQNISLKLPKYIGAYSWPPVIQTSLAAYSCAVGSTGGETATVTEQRVIGTRTYCVSKGGDGYAGGYGRTYTYTTANGSGTKTTKFTLMYQSCGVWQGDGTTEYADCQAAQSSFDANLDTFINSLM